MATASDKTLLPLSPMDAVMHGFGFVILYIFPPSSSSYNLDKLQSSFISLVEQDYRILIGELYVDPSTGVVNVKQTAESLEKGAEGILFETNPENPKTTEQAIQERSLDLMPTTRGETELICVKGTLLNDGGLAIGVNASHTLFDGEAMFTFMTVWGQHYSGVPKEQRLVVNHDRHLLKGKGKPSAMQHPEFRVVAESDDAASSYVSTVDAITALFTILISRARGHGQNVRITTGVNARRRLEPPLPPNYVGNVIFNAFSTFTSTELQLSEEKGVSPMILGKLARRVRESILQRTDEYLRDAIDFLTEQSDIAAVQVGTNFVFGHDLMFTSWLHMGMYNAEFDGIHPWFACAPQLPCYDGFVMVTEARKGGDGIDVGVFLECTAMEKLKKIFAEQTLNIMATIATPVEIEGDVLIPLSAMDAVMNTYRVVVLYIYPPPSSEASAFNLDKLQRSFVTLVNEDYPVLVGELHVHGKTISVKQTPVSRNQGAKGIRFETIPISYHTTNDAIDSLSWEFMPKPRAQKEIIAVKGSILADGGMAIGVDCSHVLFDGESMLTFMKVWNQHYSKVRKNARLVVNHDRYLLSGTRETPRLSHPEFLIAPLEPLVRRKDGSTSKFARDCSRPQPREGSAQATKIPGGVWKDAKPPGHTIFKYY
ncbi:uncharacterized protein PITG_13096 [Phytophthora infestans T30-4]|uniref:Transferase n=1 Tax=Phytophthora infestans (strain T30-4) TaxID=403677 RepID=D0NKA2_PHYIT|nr:uncharacterized protein PITG_13096 [Phytophthora infestans T30-4]EEY59939.1 conserved hypothetical protein [Phytophthora infestans T30-4]|eukprot:XP_002900624.1 conserved hypothetical protein [Phytophthora infestans T30-4]